MAGMVEVVVRAVDQITAPLQGFTKELETFKSALTVSLGGLSVAIVFRKFIDEASAAEQSMVKFNRAFNAFGAQAGQTRTELERFATATQLSSRFSDDAVRNMQTQLLRFTSITDENFKKARTAILDISEAMGTDLESAAFAVGRALESPQQGMRLLRTYGIILSDQQKDLIEKLTKTGRTAEAQGVILDAVARIYGGSAADGANTFSGALDQLNNKFGDLFEKQGLIDSLREAVKKMIDALDSDLVVGSINIIAAAFQGWALIIGELIDKFDKLMVLLKIKPQTDLQKAFDEQTEAVERYTKALEELETAKKYRNNPFGELNVQRVQREVDRARAEVEDTTRAVNRAQVNERGGRRGVKTRERTGPDANELNPIVRPIISTLDGLEAVVSKAKRNTVDPLLEDTRTGVQKAADAANELRAKLEVAFDKGLIDAKEFNRRLDDIYDSVGLDGRLEDTAKKVTEPLNQISEAQKKAAQNIQDAFVTMFLNVDKGLKGMVQGFLQAFKQILANAAALDLARALGLEDKLTKGGSGSGTVVGSVVKGIFSLFGGKAGGGNFKGFSLVGEEGPELVYSAGTSRVMSNRALNSLSGGTQSIVYSPSTSVVINGDASERERAQLRAELDARDARSQREMIRLLERNGIKRLR